MFILFFYFIIFFFIFVEDLANFRDFRYFEISTDCHHRRSSSAANFMAIFGRSLKITIFFNQLLIRLQATISITLESIGDFYPSCEKLVLHLNSSFKIQMPFPDDESLVKVQICRNIERNKVVSLDGSLERNSSKISWVVACPIVFPCDAMKVLIWRIRSSFSFPCPVSLLGKMLFLALIFASSWLEWTGSVPSADELLMPIWSPLKWGLTSKVEEDC